MIFSRHINWAQARSEIIKTKKNKKPKKRKNADDDPYNSKGNNRRHYAQYLRKRLRYHYHNYDINPVWTQWYHNGPKNTSRSYNGNKISLLFEEIKENIKSLENLNKILDKRHDGSLKKVIPCKRFNLYKYSKSFLKHANMKEASYAEYFCYLTDF